jgi:hypothetical protein
MRDARCSLLQGAASHQQPPQQAAVDAAPQQPQQQGQQWQGSTVRPFLADM